MADISKIRIEGTSYDIKDKIARAVAEKLIEKFGEDVNISVTVSSTKEPTTDYPKIASGDDINAVAGKVNKHLSDLKTNYDGIIGNWVLQRNKAYSEGDVAYLPSLPAYCRLVCVQAGTTDSAEPNVDNIDLDQVSAASIMSESIGNLDNLNTQNKTNLVSAINELSDTVNGMTEASEEDVQNIINEEYTDK